MPHLLFLPLELHFHICSYLTEKAVCDLSRTCQSFLALCNTVLTKRISGALHPRREQVLFWAISQNHLELTKRILDACSSLDVNITRICEPLTTWYRAQQGDIRAEDVDWQECIQCNALGCAVRNRNLELAKILLDRGADPSPVMLKFHEEAQRRHYGDWESESSDEEDFSLENIIPRRTPLWISIAHGDLDFVKFLLHNGADPNGRCYEPPVSGIGIDRIGRPPLSVALEVCRDNPDNIKIVQVLLNAGADVEARCRIGGSLLEQSIASRVTAAFEMVYSRVVAGRVLGLQEKRELLRVAATSCHKAMEVLVSEQTISYADFRTGTTALHETCKAALIDATRFLVEYGANINVKDRLGNTPLHAVASMKFKDADASLRSPEVLRYLIEKGADVHARNKDGFAALDLVLKCWPRGNEKKAMARVLVDAGAEATRVMWVTFQTKGLKDDAEAFEKILEDQGGETGVEELVGLTEEMVIENSTWDGPLPKVSDYRDHQPSRKVLMKILGTA